MQSLGIPSAKKKKNREKCFFISFSAFYIIIFCFFIYLCFLYIFLAFYIIFCFLMYFSAFLYDFLLFYIFFCIFKWGN